MKQVAGCLAFSVLAIILNSGAASIPSGRVFRSLSDLPFDENDKLSTHLLVYPERCSSIVQQSLGNRNQYGYAIHPVGTDAEVAFFGDREEIGSDSSLETIQDCPAVCVERGVDRSVVTSSMPQYHYDGRKNFVRWFEEECSIVEQGFMSYYHSPLNIFWVNSRGERSPRGKLEYGGAKAKFIMAYLGHTFVLVDQETEEVILEHIVEFKGMVCVGMFDSLVDETKNFDLEINRTLHREFDRHLRVKRTFSPLGFTKSRLPNDLFASMGAYYYNNRNARIREEWRSKTLYINWWEVDAYFVPITQGLKKTYQTRLQSIVEEWTGVPLEYTNLYGMRRYETGARLLTHVDREATHAASLIINIEQGNLTTPWTVEIHDHADRLHEVVMAPGDMVFYESAKCLHARNTPLQGGFYVNMFAHYRPKGDPDWFTRGNPEGTPEPLINVGECRLSGGGDQYSQGAVQCDNPAIGPHLSPSLFKARSGDDLFDWWRRVGRQPVIENTGSREEL